MMASFLHRFSWPLAVAVVLTVNLWRPVHDSDLFWQVRLGEIILDTGQIPATEPFLVDQLQEPFVPVAWGGQVLLAAARRLGGWPLVHLVDGLVWVFSLVVAGRAVRAPVSPSVIAVAIVFANYVMYSSVSTRPQTFALLGYALLLVALQSSRPLVWGCLILVLWQNVHPSVAVGLIHLGILAAVLWLRWLRGAIPTPWQSTTLVLFAGLAMFATPAGWSLVTLSAHNADISRWLEINEWLPLWDLEARGDSRIEVWIGLVVSLGLLIWRGRRVALEDLAPAVMLAGMAILSYRFVMFWSVAMIPVWSRILGSTPRPSESSKDGLIRTLGWMIAIGLPIGISTIHRPSHRADYLPDQALDRLQAERLTGTLYTNTVWAGLAIEKGYPNWRVSHDGRYYLRSRDAWQHHYEAMAGMVPIEELVAKWNPVAFVLRTPFDAGLIQRLEGHSAWCELVREKDCVVFVRRNSR